MSHVPTVGVGLAKFMAITGIFWVFENLTVLRTLLKEGAFYVIFLQSFFLPFVFKEEQSICFTLLFKQKGFKGNFWNLCCFFTYFIMRR